MAVARHPSTNAGFLAGGGDSGALMRARDWSATPLGPPAAWPQPLRTLVGVMLGSNQPMFIAWGPARTLLYNDAYAEILAAKHPAALGRDILDVWHEIRDDLVPIVEQAYRGEPVHMDDIKLLMLRKGYPEETHFSFSYTPIQDEAGAVAGFFCPCTEITRQVIAERRQAFLVELGDALRDLAAPEAITAAASGLVGRHLGVGRAGYGEIDAAGEVVTVERDWTEGAMASLAGAARVLDAFGPEVIAELRAGRTLLVEDCRADPRTASPAHLPTWEGIGTRALVVVPLVRDGRLVAILYAHSAGPRRWAELEVALAEDAARRTWAAVERARAEADLRESEARFRAFVTASSDAVYRMSPDWSRMRRLDGLGFLADTRAPNDAWLGDYIHPDDQPRVLAAIREAIRGGGMFELEHRVRRADGSFGWTHSRAVPIADAAGGIVEWLGAARDVTARRETEDALRRSEALLRRVLEIETVGVVFFDLAGGIHGANDAFLRMVGHDRAELEAGEVRYERLTPPEWRWRDERTVAELRSTGKAGPFEKQYARKDGSRFWILCADKMLDERTAVEFVVDVTERKAAEEALGRLNAALETEVAARTAERDRVWQLSPDLMCVARTDGTLVSVNPAWERRLGWPAEWLAGRNAAEIKHPDDAERTAAELARLATGHPTVNFEDRYRTKEGGWRWISWVIEPEGDLIYCIGRDVTAEREAATELAESRRRLATLLDNLPGFAYRCRNEPDRPLEYVSEGVAAVVGHPPSAFGGPDAIAWGRLVHPDDRERVRRETQAAVAARRPFEHEYRVLTRDGEERWVWERGRAVHAPSGEVEGIEGFVSDVTDQRRTEDALRQVQKMEAVGQLTGGIAHDFNNLLGAVMGSLDLIRRRPAEVERVRRLAEAGLQAADRGAKLTGQLLAFSRAQRIELRPVVVAEVVEGMRELLARTLGPQVRVSFELDGTRLPVLCDPTQLEMAVLNLAINARDAMPDGGGLAIATAPLSAAGDAELKAGEYVELSVADTGTGMPAEVLERAFDPFFTTKGVGKGTGLGLSQVYGIAKQSGGAVRIESRPGQGTTVRVYLPRTEGAVRPEEETAPPGEAPAEVAATVLLVDDDPDVRRMLAASLDALGYRVLEAEDGPSGLAALGAHAPDLMMVDFAMPGMNGAEVARAARERRPDLPIVFASGYADTAAIEAVAGEDAVVLRKPFRLDELQAVLAAALDGRP